MKPTLKPDPAFDLFVILLVLLVTVMLVGGSTRLVHIRAVHSPNLAPSVVAPHGSTVAPRTRS